MRHRTSIVVYALLTVLLACGLGGCMFGGNKPTEKTGDAHDLSQCSLWCSPGTVDYDGTEKKVKINVNAADGTFLTSYTPDTPHNDLTVTYADNVNAGTATATVTAKKSSTKFIGQATCTFTIQPKQTTATDEATLRALLSDGNVGSIRLEGHVTTDAPLTVPEGVSLNLNDWRLTCQNLTVAGSLRVSEAGDLTVNGDLTVTGTLSLGGNTFAHGVVTNNGTIKCYKADCKLYTDAQPAGNGAYDKVTLYRRRALSECTITLSETETEYTGSAIKPTVTVSLEGQTLAQNEYRTFYENNTHAGTATVSVTADMFSEQICGETTVTFTVLPAEYAAKTLSELKRMLQDPDYNRFRVDFSDHVDGITVPQGKTVYITESAHTVTVKNAVIDGALEIGSNQTVFLQGTLAVSGKLVNAGTVFATPALARETTVENNGNLYADDTLTLLKATGNSIVRRRQLTTADVRLESTSGNYTGLNHVLSPIFTAGNDEPSPLFTYLYTESNKTMRAAKDAGDITVTLRANPCSTRYYGEVELAYRIDRVAATVTTVAELLEKSAKNESTGILANYNPITVDFDCTLPASFELSGKTELIVPANRTLTCTDGLTVYANSKLTVTGTFYQAGSVTLYGDFVNDGTAYFNGTKPDKVTGTGSHTLRKPLQSTSAVGFPQTVNYDGTEATLRPSVNLTLDGTALTLDTDYTVRYVNADHVTDVEKAQAVMTANPRSTRVYGTGSSSKTLTYEILPGRRSVTTFDELKTATDNVRPGTTVCNWEQITVTADLEVTPERFKTIQVTVRPNTTVVFGHYAIKSNGTYSQNFKFTNNGKVKMRCATVDGKDCFGGPNAVNCTAESTGEYIGYADTVNAFINLSRRCTQVFLEQDLELGPTTQVPINAVVDLKSGGSLTIDLQGHTIKAYVFDCTLTYGAITVKNGSIIASSATNDIRYIVRNAAGDRKLTFQNVTGLQAEKFEFDNCTQNDVVGV